MHISNYYISTFAMIKPDAYTSIGKIIDAICQTGFIINKLKMSRFSIPDAQGFYQEHFVSLNFVIGRKRFQDKPFFQNLIDFVTSDVVVGMELISDEAVEKWRSLIGPTSTQVKIIS